MRKWLRWMVQAPAEVWSKNCRNFCNQQNLNGVQVDIPFVSIQIEALNELSAFIDCLVMNSPYFALVTASALIAGHGRRRLIDFWFTLTTNLRFVPSLVTPGENKKQAEWRETERRREEREPDGWQVQGSINLGQSIIFQPPRFAGRHRNVCQIYQPARRLPRLSFCTPPECFPSATINGPLCLLFIYFSSGVRIRTAKNHFLHQIKMERQVSKWAALYGAKKNYWHTDPNI